MLLEAGANINVPASKYNGRTALQAASEGGHLDIVKKLLGMGVIVNANPAHYGGRTALQAAANGHAQVVRYLLRMGADVNLTDLQHSALEVRLEVVEELFRAGANVNAPGGYLSAELALYAAAEGGHLDVVEKLLAAGTQVDAISGNRKQTALQVAFKRGHVDVAKKLKMSGARSNLGGDKIFKSGQYPDAS
jgi:ankyrin repeat protein